MATATTTAPAPRKRGRKPKSTYRRGPDAGNLIWKLYRDEIGDSDRARLMALLVEKQVPYDTFLGHTVKGRRLDSLPTKHLILYRDFFLIATDNRWDLSLETRKEERALGPRPAQVRGHRQARAPQPTTPQ